MSVSFQCPSCAKSLSVRDEFAGKKGRCPGCTTIIAIPAPTRAETNGDRIQFTCPQCDHKVSVGRQHAGRQGQCPRCGHVFSIPNKSTIPAFPPLKSETFRCAECAGVFSSKAVVLDEDGRTVCRHCFSNNSADQGDSTGRNKLLVSAGVGTGAVLVITLVICFLVLHAGKQHDNPSVDVSSNQPVATRQEAEQDKETQRQARDAQSVSARAS